MIELSKAFTFRGTKVMFTKDLADFFTVSYATLMQSFENKKEKFTEGSDYFKLVGKELADFKHELKTQGKERNRTAHYVLFTVNGWLKVAKYLRSEKAWELISKAEIKL